MNIDTNTIFSMTEANQNFSMVARTVDHSKKLLKRNAAVYKELAK